MKIFVATLRQVKDSLEILRSVQEKAEKLLGTVEKLGKMTRKVRVSILKCQTLPEIEAVSAPFKTGSKVLSAQICLYNNFNGAKRHLILVGILEE